MAKKRRLARGLDDLLAQHDQDLPFLDAYGPADVSGSDLPETGRVPVGQLMEVIERLLKVEGQHNSKWIQFEPEENGVKITAQSGDSMLPLVQSDLGAPGLENGNLAKDRSEATVTIVQWGIPARRFLERLCEHWAEC